MPLWGPSKIFASLRQILKLSTRKSSTHAAMASWGLLGNWWLAVTNMVGGVENLWNEIMREVNVLQLPDIFRLQHIFRKTDKTFDMEKIQKCIKLQSKASHAIRYTQQNVLSVFISHVIKTKDRDHSRNGVKNLGYDRWLIYEQPHLESGLCWFSFARYLQKCVTQIYRALYGDAMFVPF